MFVHPVHLIKVCVSYYAAITGYMNDHKVYTWFLRGETEKEEIIKSMVEAYLSAQHAFSAPSQKIYAQACLWEEKAISIKWEQWNVHNILVRNMQYWNEIKCITVKHK